MRNEDTLSIDKNAHNDVEESPDNLAERRQKALALWKARQKRSNMAAEFRDSCDLSRCAFLENDSVGKRAEYRLQVERACGLNSRDGIAIVRGNGASVSAMRGGGSLTNIGKVPPQDRGIRLAPKISFDRQANSVPYIPTTNTVSELERRRCLVRKQLHRKSGTSIGQWAFASEQNNSIEPSSVNAAAPVKFKTRIAHETASNSIGPTCILPRKRPAAIATSVNDAYNSGKNARDSTKRAKASTRGLLEILGGRPESIDRY
jgi:hypothetical protein